MFLGVAVAVQQGEARDRIADAEQQRHAAFLLPVGVEVGIRREPPLLIDVAARQPGPELREVVGVELEQVVEDGALGEARDFQCDGHGARTLAVARHAVNDVDWEVEEAF